MSYKMKIRVKNHSNKMTPEELQEHLKLKRGNGSHRSKKDYKRIKKVEW